MSYYDDIDAVTAMMQQQAVKLLNADCRWRALANGVLETVLGDEAGSYARAIGLDRSLSPAEWRADTVEWLLDELVELYANYSDTDQGDELGDDWESTLVWSYQSPLYDESSEEWGMEGTKWDIDEPAGLVLNMTTILGNTRPHKLCFCGGYMELPDSAPEGGIYEGFELRDAVQWVDEWYEHGKKLDADAPLDNGVCLMRNCLRLMMEWVGILEPGDGLGVSYAV